MKLGLGICETKSWNGLQEIIIFGKSSFNVKISWSNWNLEPDGTFIIFCDWGNRFFHRFISSFFLYMLNDIQRTDKITGLLGEWVYESTKRVFFEIPKETGKYEIFNFKF